MNYEVLKDSVADVVKTNGNGEITGALLQQVLLAMINSLGTGYQFMGKATTSTNPGTPDQKEFYIAIEAGVYPNFGNAEIAAGNIGLFLYSSSWTLVSLAVPTKDYVDSTFLMVADLADEIGESTVIAMTQKAVSDALAEKFDASNVVQEPGESQTKVISQAVISSILADINESIVDIQENYAKANGTYPELTAGAANNLVGHGDTPAEITYRTAGGSADIGSGTATLSRIKGKTLVWNQLVNSLDAAEEVYGITRTLIADGKGLHYSGTSTNSTNFTGTAPFNVIEGHKYYVAANGCPANCRIGDAVNIGEKSAIYTAASSTTKSLGIYIPATAAIEADIYFIAIDLTLMFGAGNEPSTVAEFEALYSLPYYAYNPGQLINNKATKIKTVGFNQWDEEWESGKYSLGAGVKVVDDTCIRSKNAIPCFPSTQYYFKGATNTCYIIFFANDGSYLGESTRVALGADGVFTTPANAAYLRFWRTNSTSYNHDICINLSWSGYRNGEYEPYWESELELNLATLTGKKDGAGESVVVFPDGLLSAGNVHDEILSDGKTAIKRIGKVDLGTLNWYATPYAMNVFACNLANLSKESASTDNKIVCGYTKGSNAVGQLNNLEWNTQGLHYVPEINLKNTAYDDAATFKTAMSGVYLYYELETPETYELDSELQMNYRVDDFGTEERLPADTESAVSAPLVADIQYAMNAVDTLRRLPENYISKSSFDNFCTELADKLGAAIGKTITITATYDSEDKEYDFAITITTPSEP